jgi:NADPH-dependent 7-cyano-7-deazaguanine reductase QueF
MQTYTAPAHVKRVILTSGEVTTMGGENPDFYTVEISYTPGKLILCTKALKEWFTEQRSVIHSAEGFARTVGEVVCKVLGVTVIVTVRQVPRGGIGIEAVAIVIPSQL